MRSEAFGKICSKGHMACMANYLGEIAVCIDTILKIFPNYKNKME